MSILLSLLATTGGYGASDVASIPRLTLNSSVNVHVDANSLFANWIAAGIETVGDLGSKLKKAGVTSSNSAIPGQSWDDMRLRANDVDSAFVSGKTNVLITGETTNQIYNMNSSVEDTIRKSQQYISERRVANPDWIILLVGTIPRADLASDDLNRSANQKLLDVDAYHKSHLDDVGVNGFVDVRAFSPEWFGLRSDGMTAKFMDSLTTCNSYNGSDPDRVHPINEPRTAFANAIAAGLDKLPARI